MEWIPTSSSESSAAAPLANTDNAFKETLASAAVQDTRVSNQEISVTLAGSLNIGAIFTGAVSANEVGYWLDAMAYSDRYEETPAANGLVLANRFGFGLRVMFRVRKLNPKANLNYGLLGAAIDAGFAEASYEIDAIGFGTHAAEALAMILEGVGAYGPALNSDTFYKLNTSITKNLVAYIKTNLKSLQPTRVATLLRSALDEDSLQMSHAILFAMRQIKDGKRLIDALAAAGDMNPIAIRLAFANVMGDVSDTTKPTKADSKTAGEWLADE
ncbi:MAG: hypothetical protein QOF62_2140 [Pyrinomonadaceae bacterium]|jgi:hypothetical protein|nr:hypothetical protein [Pyrinomonadaceae bacterium]